MDGDHVADVLVGDAAGAAGSQLYIFSGADGSLIRKQFAFGSAFNLGIYVDG